MITSMSSYIEINQCLKVKPKLVILFPKSDCPLDKKGNLSLTKGCARQLNCLTNNAVLNVFRKLSPQPPVPNTDDTPKSLKAALNMFDGPLWRAACKKEVTSLRDKKVWKLVDQPTNKKVIRGMWLFKRKPLLDGCVKHKAQYVAMGKTEVEGEDYGETFAPTGKPSSLRLLVAVAAINDWQVHQMDAVTAFLNSDLHDEV